MTENWQQLSIEQLDPDFSFGRMSSEHSAVTAAKTSKRCLKKSSASQSQPRQICLRLTNGASAEASWETDGVSLGELTMRNIGECPNAVVESRLSQILQVRVPLTYFLSDTACQGILRRSANRGKQLPDILDTALKCQIAWYPLAKRYFDERGIALKDAYIDMLPIDTIYAVDQGGGKSQCNVSCNMSPNSGIYEADTARTLDGNGGNPTCNQGGMAIVEVWNGRGDGNGGNGVSFQLTGDHDNRITDYTNIVTYGLDRASFNQGANAKFDFAVEEDLAPTVVAKGPGAVATPTSRVFYAVRRLTPLECERLQGFPDGWTDIGEWTDSKGKRHKTSDAQRYRALGNSLALPFWAWLINRISARYDRKPTMCSLFDGIGGFPLCWERTNGKGTAVWASEIEEFPMAVTKKHFEEDTE